MRDGEQKIKVYALKLVHLIVSSELLLRIISHYKMLRIRSFSPSSLYKLLLGRNVYIDGLKNQPIRS